jgi:hypothetical protein
LEIEIQSGSGFTSRLENDTLIVTFSDSYQPSKIQIYQDGSTATSGSVTITYSSATPQTYSLPKRLAQAAEMNLPNISVQSAEDSTYVQTVTLRYTENWEQQLNLPVYDENGNKYYYWAVEKSVQGYEASYSFSDADDDTTYCINAEKPGSGEITVQNTKTESDSVTMPSTGGGGRKWYYIIGSAIMLSSAALYNPFKRRKNAE